MLVLRLNNVGIPRSALYKAFAHQDFNTRLIEDDIKALLSDIILEERNSKIYLTNKGLNNAKHLIRSGKFEKENELVTSIVNQDFYFKDQYYLPEEDPFSFRITLLKILKKAEKYLVIVDPYIDETIFAYLEVLVNVSIILVTSNKRKRIYKNLLLDYTKTHSNASVLFKSNLHQRLIIIDKLGVWNLDCSINNEGAKASMINRITNDEERLTILREYQQ